MTRYRRRRSFAYRSSLAGPQRDAGTEAMWRRTDALRPASLSNLVHVKLGA